MLAFTEEKNFSLWNLHVYELSLKPDLQLSWAMLRCKLCKTTQPYADADVLTLEVN